MGLDKGVNAAWLYKIRRHYVLTNDLLDNEERYEERKNLVEYGGFFANPEVYGEVKRREEQKNIKVENFDDMVRYLKEEERNRSKVAKESGDLLPVIDEIVSDQ